MRINHFLISNTNAAMWLDDENEADEWRQGCVLPLVYNSKVCLWIGYSMTGGWWMLLHQTTTQGVDNSSSTYCRGARERWTKGWGVAAQHKANQQTYRFNSVDQQHLPLCCNHQKPESKHLCLKTIMVDNIQNNCLCVCFSFS